MKKLNAFFSVATACTAVLFCTCAKGDAAARVTASFGGRVSLPAVNSSLAVMGATPPWTWVGGCGGFEVRADGSRAFTVTPSDSTPPVDGVQSAASTADGGVALRWTLTPRADACYKILGVIGTFAFAEWRNGVVVCDGERLDLPKGREPMTFFTKTLSRVELIDGAGTKHLTFAFPKPTLVVLQNNRQWQEDFSLRILLPNPERLREGTTNEIAFTLHGAGGYSEADAKPVKLAAGKDWIPLAVKTGIAAGSALDFSALRGTDAPAGKWGRVIAKGQNFEFEGMPGVPQRFYGMNLCGDANTPSYEEARQWARFMAHIGYNAVRFHHHESTLTWGVKDPGKTELNADAMKRFDGLVAACVEAGLYMTTDLYVSRTGAGITWRSVGIDRDGTMAMDDVKVLAPADEGVYSNLVAWTRNFLGHVNAYTGRRLADEPALAWISLVNEGNLDKFGVGSFAPWPAWRAAWTKWIAERKKLNPAVYGKVSDDFPRRKDGVWMQFIQDVEARFAARMKALLRDELKCRALITNVNDGWGNTVGFVKPRSESYDYVDCHFYVDHPSFLEKPWRLPSECPNRNPMLGLAMGAQKCAATRLLNRPFTITEYNYSGPGRFRGVGGIATGAEAALQNWAGLWKFAWSHGRQGIAKPETKTMGYFDISGDPLSLAAERASICLFLRRDLGELSRTYAAVMPPKAFDAPDARLAALTHWSWIWAGWYAKIGSVYGDAAPAGAQCAGVYPEIVGKTSDQVKADLAEAKPGDGAVEIDSDTGTFLLSTPRTCGGFAEGGTIRTTALEADLGTTPATLWASSVSAEPIAASKRILVTHLTDVQNTGIHYADATLRILLGFGGLPHLMRAGTAQVALTVAPGNWTVWSLETDGARRTQIPATFANGRLCFTADVARDPAHATFLYEVVRE